MTTICSFFVCLIISGNSAYRKHVRTGRETEVWYAVITVYVPVMSRNLPIPVMSRSRNEPQTYFWPTLYFLSCYF